MKVMLINPPPLGKQTYTNRILYPPLGLAYIAAILRNKGLMVSLLDANALDYNLNRIINCMKEFNPDIVGFASTTGKLEDIHLLANSIKAINDKTITVLGGAHPTSEPESAIAIENIDFIIVGEGEKTFPLLIDYLIKDKDYSSLKGIGYKKNGKIFVNERSDFIENLDDLPIPSYDLLPMKKYSSVQSSTQKVMMMITSRGCPYRCTFCAVPKILGYKYRYFSALRVVEEMEYLKNNYGIEEIHFKDSIFNFNVKRISEICDLLIQKNVNMTWLCNARVDGVNKEILKKMKEAGCISVIYGIESGSPDILKRLKKGFQIETARKAIEAAKEVGIEVTAGYIIGNPEDTEKTINETIDFAIDMDTDFAGFNFLTPLPGTEIYEEALEKNWFVKDYDTNNIRYDKCSINATNLPTKQLEKYLKMAYRRFYFRPNYIIRRFKKINSHDLRASYNGLKAILKI